jgi:Protein of unknown function (DUF4236)
MDTPVGLRGIMHIRFRKSIKVLPGVKVNISRHGISTSVGPRGAHLTFNRFGVRQSVGLPGTGLSEVGYLVKDKPSNSGRAKQSSVDAAEVHHLIHHGEGMGCELEGFGCLIVILLIAAVAAYFAANSLHLLPANFVSQLLQQLTQWVHTAGF